MEEEVASAAIKFSLMLKNGKFKEQIAQNGQRNGCYNAQSMGLTMLY